MKPEKKPALSLVIGMGKSKGHDEDDEESDDEGGEYSAIVDELADVLGVADDKKQDFADAFKAAVMHCK